MLIVVHYTSFDVGMQYLLSNPATQGFFASAASMCYHAIATFHSNGLSRNNWASKAFCELGPLIGSSILYCDDDDD